MPIEKKNVDRTYRNNKKPLKTVTRYTTIAGAPGSNGTNAYVCLLSQSSALIQAGERYASPTTITLAVIGLVGNERIHTNVGTITGQIPGCLSATVLNNGTTETSIQIDVTALLEIDGVINIPVTVNMSEVYGYSSEWTAADDMWDPTTWTLSTNNFTFSWGLAKKGATGSSGKGISSVTEYYAISNNNTTAPADSEFGTSFVAPTVAKPYLWNYELITYTDSTTSRTTKAIVGIRGSNGNDGRGITGITEYYAISNSNTTPPADSEFSTTVPTVTDANPYLWNYEVVSYSDNTTSRTQKVVIGYKGQDGQPGSPGAQGEPGLTGPTLRGPVKWEDQTTQRWFLNGVYNSNIPESDKWVDLMLKDGQVYRCIQPYYGTCTSPDWSTASAYWELSDKYKFVSTDLILADNGKINILGTNSIRLIAGSGSGETIVGGAQGGTGTIFYAGTSQANPTPSQAPFHVDYDGKVTAKSGTFAGYVQYPYTFISELEHSGSYSSGYYIADDRANLIADAYSGDYGMGDGGCLLLPEPNVNLNGFTYNILAVANVATKTGLDTSITLQTADSRQSHDSPFKIYAFQGNSTRSYAMVRFYGGSIRVTCMPYHTGSDEVGYFWAVTEATGGVDCYGVNQFEWTSSGGGSYWHFNSGDQITASISNPPLNYSYWGHRNFKTSTTSTTIRVTVSGNTQSSSNIFYLCLDSQITGSAVLTFSGSTTQTYTITLADNTNHSFNMFYAKSVATSSDNINILFEVVSSGAVPAYACSISPIHGYTNVSMDNAVYRIVAEETLPSIKDRNVVYLKRDW